MMPIRFVCGSESFQDLPNISVPSLITLEVWCLTSIRRCLQDLTTFLGLQFYISGMWQRDWRNSYRYSPGSHKLMNYRKQLVVRFDYRVLIRMPVVPLFGACFNGSNESIDSRLIANAFRRPTYLITAIMHLPQDFTKVI